MMAAQQTHPVPASVLDSLAEGANEFWQAVQEQMTDKMVEIVEAVLEQEVEAFVGAKWHQRGAKGRRMYRCGYRPRQFMALGRAVQFRMPRVRQAGFRSRFLGFRSQRSAEVDRAIANAYVAGPSMRETTALFYQLWGTSVSPSTVSVIVGTLDQQRKEFQTRPLSDDYLYVALDAMYVRCQMTPSPQACGARGAQTVQKVAVLLARGIRGDGRRELLDFRLAPAERESAWEGFLTSLYQRGLEGKNTALFLHDGSEGLANALDTVFGPGGRQRCVCHKLGNVWDAVSDKTNHESVRSEAAKVYHAETADQARQRLAAFAAAWRDREPEAVAVLESGFEHTLSFLAVPKAHRRWVTTTNPIERAIRELRRRLRPMGTFQNLASCRRLVYVAIHKLSDERRNAIPYRLWTSQPWPKTSRRRGCGGRYNAARATREFEKGFTVK